VFWDADFQAWINVTSTDAVDLNAWDYHDRAYTTEHGWGEPWGQAFVGGSEHLRDADESRRFQHRIRPSRDASVKSASGALVVPFMLQDSTRGLFDTLHACNSAQIRVSWSHPAF
jgi:hypothetical protein